MNTPTIAPGPTALATPCPDWCNRRHPLHVESDTRLHSGVIETRGIAVSVELGLEDGPLLHLDERDASRSMTPQGALGLSYALEVAAETIRRGQR